MLFNKFTPLTKLDSSKIKWCIQVKAQTVWKGITRDTKEFRGINIIFVDDSGYRIHAFVNSKFAPLFEELLQEGKVYNITNFMVQAYTGMESHRCIRYDKHIYFADYTKLEIAEKVALKIPEYSFDLFQLKDLESMEANKRFLCDVVGVIKDPQPVNRYKTNNNEDKVQKKFSITDGSCCIKVTLFDQLAETFEEALNKEEDHTVIIILASVKIGTFQGDLTLTNYPATRFYLNINHESVKELTARSAEPLFHVQNSSATEFAREEESYKIMTVSDIKQLKENYIEKEVICQVTLRKVQEDLQWYCNICPTCDKELETVDGRFKCNSKNCKLFFPYPERRFQVCTLCSDKTGGIRIILQDTEVRRITGKTMFDVDLEQAMGSNETKFPTILQQIVNCDYTITLKISKENVVNGSEVYKSCDIVEGHGLFACNAEVQEMSAEPEDATNFIETTVGKSCPLKETPNTAKSSNTSRVRKSVEEPETTEDTDIPLKDLMKPEKAGKVQSTQHKKKSPRTEKLKITDEGAKIVKKTSCIPEEQLPVKRIVKPKKKYD